MRQLYETPQDREANARLADDFGRALGFALDIAPKACLFDYWVLTPIGQYGIAEMRIRSCEKEKHDTLFFSATKWRHLTQLADRFRIPFFLVVKWTNGQGYFLWRGQKFGKTFGGRSRMNMRDSYDQEELIQIPITEFHPFHNK
jgi:hypothetical protein